MYYNKLVFLKITVWFQIKDRNELFEIDKNNKKSIYYYCCFYFCVLIASILNAFQVKGNNDNRTETQTGSNITKTLERTCVRRIRQVHYLKKIKCSICMYGIDVYYKRYFLCSFTILLLFSFEQVLMYAYV